MYGEFDRNKMIPPIPIRDMLVLADSDALLRDGDMVWIKGEIRLLKVPDQYLGKEVYDGYVKLFPTGTVLGVFR